MLTKRNGYADVSGLSRLVFLISKAPALVVLQRGRSGVNCAAVYRTLLLRVEWRRLKHVSKWSYPVTSDPNSKKPVSKMQVTGRALGSQGCSCSTLPHQAGKQFLAFQSRARVQSKRVAAQRVVAANNPVATVEKTLEKTVSKVAESAKKVVGEVTDASKPDLNKVVLLQGARSDQLLTRSPTNAFSILPIFF